MVRLHWSCHEQIREVDFALHTRLRIQRIVSVRLSGGLHREASDTRIACSDHVRMMSRPAGQGCRVQMYSIGITRFRPPERNIGAGTLEGGFCRERDKLLLAILAGTDAVVTKVLRLKRSDKISRRFCGWAACALSRSDSVEPNSSTSELDDDSKRQRQRETAFSLGHPF